MTKKLTVLLALMITLTVIVFFSSCTAKTDNPSSDSGSTSTSTDTGPSDEEGVHVHSWSEWTVEKAPSCTEEGIQKRSCSCGETEKISISKTQHVEAIDHSVSATCTQTGLTEGRHCSVCNAVLVAQTVIPIAAHTEVIDPAVSSTCTQTGLTEGKHCSVCNTVLIAQNVVPLAAHTGVTDPAVAATCMNTGLTEGKHCSACNTVLVVQSVIPRTAHTEVADPAVAATCTQTGLTEGKHCSRCNTVTVQQLVISKISHQYSDKYDESCNVCGFIRNAECAHLNTQIIPGIEATCTQSGISDGKKCSTCGEILVIQTIIPLKQHSVVIDQGISSTCTATGLTEGQHCSICNTIIIPQMPTAIMPHTEVIDTAIAASCIAPGLTAGKHCSVCNTIIIPQISTPVLPHTEVIDAEVKPTYTSTGLTAGKHCSVCKTIIIAQQIIPQLEPVYHNIVYYDEKLPGYPKYETYAEHIGVNSLPSLSISGYKFDGWYTELDGGKKVAFIPAGSTENYILYAHWTAIKYTITYNDAPVHSNQTEYTIEDEINLSDPHWSGMKFVNWQTKNGQSITKISKGTTGNIELTATWTTYRNIVTPSDNTLLVKIYDEGNNRYYYLYDLGMIENVVLDQILTSHNKTTSSNYTMQISNSIYLSESYAKSISKTIGHSVINSSTWSETLGWSESNSLSSSAEVSANYELNVYDVLKTSVETKFGVASEITKVNTSALVTGGGMSESQSMSSEISYVENLSIGSTTETQIIIDIPGNMPNGYYTYVHAGNVRVFAIVTYDIEESNFYLNTYSVLDNMHSMVMYYTSATEVTDSCEPLDFDIPTEEILDDVNTYYYINYEKNGGSGAMPISVHEIGKETRLSKNLFTKTGYTFDGWEYRAENGTILYADSQTVKDIVAGGKTITLYAKWKANSYNVKLNLNASTIKTSPSCSSISITVSYDSGYTISVPKSNYYEFEGWYTSSGKQLTDASGKSLSNWAHTDITQIYAHWKQTHTAYTYISSRTDLENISKNLSGKYMLISNIDLSSAEWKKLGTFTGELQGNGYSISGLKTTQRLNDGGDSYGMFSKLSNATVNNINFANLAIAASHNSNDSNSYFCLGTIAGEAEKSTISNITISGSVRFEGTWAGTAYVGGFVGRATSCTFKSCTNQASVYGSKGSVAVGGIVGVSSGTSSNKCSYTSCTNNGKVHAVYKVVGGFAKSAGIVGGCTDSYSPFTSCTNNVKVGDVSGIDAWEDTSDFLFQKLYESDIYNSL